jgi:hypothetical protein
LSNTLPVEPSAVNDAAAAEGGAGVARRGVPCACNDVNEPAAITQSVIAAPSH